MNDRQLYVETTITATKDGVTLFETDCEVLVEFFMDAGEIDWRPLEFHFTGRGTEPGKRIYTKINRTEPLWEVLAANLSDDVIMTAIRDHLNNQ